MGVGAKIIIDNLAVHNAGWKMVPPTDSEQLLRRIVKQFRGGLVFVAHRLVYHSTLGLRVIKKKKRRRREQLKMFQGLCPESQGHNLALTVLYVPT